MTPSTLSAHYKEIVPAAQIDVALVACAPWYRQLGGARNLLTCDISTLEQAFACASSMEEKSYLLAVIELRATYCPVLRQGVDGDAYSLMGDVALGATLLIASNAGQGKFLALAAAEKVGGALAPWRYRDSCAHTELSIGTVAIEIEVSADGIVHVNANPFSPYRRRTNVTLRAIVASIEAAVAGIAFDARTARENMDEKDAVQLHKPRRIQLQRSGKSI